MAKFKKGYRKFRKGYRKSWKKASRALFKPVFRSSGISGGFPLRKTIKLRYNETISINPGAAAVTAQAFRANSIYDPNQSGTGHQPLFRDQWAQIYNHYVVLGSKCSCTFSPVNAGTALTAYGIRLDDDGSSSSLVVSDYIEQRKGVYAISNDNYTIQHPKTLTETFSARKWFGVTDVNDNKQDLGAAMGSNPSDVASFIVWVGPADGTSDLGAWYLTVTIDYIVQLSEPIDGIQS